MRLTGNYNPANAPPMPVTDYGLVGGTWKFQGEEELRIADTCPLWLSREVTAPDGTLGVRMAGYETNATDPDHPEWESLRPPGIVDILTGPHTQAVWYTSRRSGATVVSLGTIQWSWGLDDFTVETPATGRGSRADAGVQRFTQNLIAHCLDGKNMVADLPDGTYEIRSVSAFPQNLIVGNDGAPFGPVIIFGDGQWQPVNNQARWIVRRYTGARNPSDANPCLGPYKAADDVWYTIRGAQTGQSLIVADNGSQNGPVWVYGDAEGNWGQGPDSTQMMWRIWRCVSAPFNQPAYIMQNVCCGQLLIVAGDGGPGGQVCVFGNYNGGWGEEEDDPQKFWTFTLTP
jgi:hypothetical protein